MKILFKKILSEIQFILRHPIRTYIKFVPCIIFPPIIFKKNYRINILQKKDYK